MVLTDTPQKNLFESIAQKGKESKKQTKTVKLMRQSKANQARIFSAKQKKKKRAQRSLNLIESDSSDDELPLLSDHSSDAVLDDDEFEGAVCVPDFPDLSKEPEKRDYVLVEFEVNPKKFFVGFVTKSEDSDGDIEVKFLRRKRHVEEFYFPDTDDIASHSMSGINLVLPVPHCLSHAVQLVGNRGLVNLPTTFPVLTCRHLTKEVVLLTCHGLLVLFHFCATLFHFSFFFFLCDGILCIGFSEVSLRKMFAFFPSLMCWYAW